MQITITIVRTTRKKSMKRMMRGIEIITGWKEEVMMVMVMIVTIIVTDVIAREVIAGIMTSALDITKGKIKNMAL